mgnify:FL=1
MNKLMGFLELKEMDLPAVPWKQYSGSEKMDDHYLWTVRCAKYRGDDLNLPRCVGKDAETATAFAEKLHRRINGIVVFYPYFIAEKSGTLLVNKDKVIIEAVHDDLWNLVTHGERDVSITYKEDSREYNGNWDFLLDTEQKNILSHVPEIKRTFRNELFSKDILLEWSFAKNCDKDKKPVGKPYLVFYEARTV